MTWFEIPSVKSDGMKNRQRYNLKFKLRFKESVQSSTRKILITFHLRTLALLLLDHFCFEGKNVGALSLDGSIGECLLLVFGAGTGLGVN